MRCALCKDDIAESEFRSGIESDHETSVGIRSKSRILAPFDKITPSSYSVYNDYDEIYRYG